MTTSLQRMLLNVGPRAARDFSLCNAMTDYAVVAKSPNRALKNSNT